MFERVLIANRGEVAVRIIRACRELGVETVAVYSTADRDSLHVRLADRAVHIGPPLPADSYLRIPSLVAAATTTECDAVHPGWGFLAENAAFALACEDNDLVFIGPRAETIETMGDKIAAKEAMAEAGVPLVPGSDGAVDFDAGAGGRCRGGLPGAAQGLGGRRRARHAPRRVRRRPRCRLPHGRPPRRSRPSGRLSLRREGGRRRAPCRDPGARGWGRSRPHARRARLLDPAPAPEARRGVALAGRHAPRSAPRWRSAAHRACEALRYRGAGTIEFLLDADGRFYFIEMNTRLQVEHPVTELVTGIDLAHAQLAVAAGEGLPARGPRGPARPCDRVSDQRRGPGRGLPAGAGPRIPLPAAARPGSARRHARRGGLRDPAVLRLADREGDRLGRGPRGRRSPAAGARSPSSSSKASRRRATSRSTSSRARSSGAATTRRPSSPTRLRRSSHFGEERHDDRTPRRPARGSLRPLPVGRDRTAARIPLRGRARPVHAGAGGGRRRRSAGARRDDRRRVERLAARAARRARAQHPPHRALRARPGRGAARGVRSTRRFALRDAIRRRTLPSS